MITLYGFGQKFGLPDASAFVTKADILLQMAGLPYALKTDGNLMKAPKKKFPFIDDKGKIVADSTFIRFYLEDTYDISFNQGVSDERQAALWGLERTAENEMYFIVMSTRWLSDANFEKGPKVFFDKAPALLRPFIIKNVRNSIKKTSWLHGLGRHSEAEQLELVKRWILACSHMLGEHDYFGGTSPCAEDASLFAFLIGIDCEFFDSPFNGLVSEHHNLVLYRERMMQRFYGEQPAQDAAAA